MHNIEVIETPDLEASACALPRRRIISLRGVEDEQEYLTALHEIGHIELKHFEGPYERAKVRCEQEAWEWAIEHSRIPLTTISVEHIRECLGSYLAGSSGMHPETRQWLAGLKPRGLLKVAGPKGRLP